MTLRTALESRIRDHIESVRGAGACPPIVHGDATGHQPPYIVVALGSKQRHPERVHAGARGDHLTDLIVTSTAATIPVAELLDALVVDALTPGYDPTELPGVDGAAVVVSHSASMPADVDRTVTSTGTNTHPAYAVERFRLRTQPTGA